jgi:hypothetical protein
MSSVISDDESGLGVEESLSSENSTIAALGRISGKLLSDNLIRNGVDLTFRNAPTDLDLLYLDVSNKRIGINKDSPALTLEVIGTGRVTEDVKVVGTSARLGNVIFNTNGTVSSLVGPINIIPAGSDPYLRFQGFLNTDIAIKDNYIRSTVTNQNLEFQAHGTGLVDILSNSSVTGDLNVTQNILVDGNVAVAGRFIVGDNPVDTVSFTPDFTQSLIPGINNIYDLGSAPKTWSHIYLYGLQGVDSVNVKNVQVGSLALSGNTISSTSLNGDVALTAFTGRSIKLESFDINNSIITNTSGQNTVFYPTDRGFLRINDTTAMVVPTGTDRQRTYSEAGETRWNTDRGYLEIYDGEGYVVATGGGAIVGEVVMQELGNLWSLMLG